LWPSQSGQNPIKNNIVLIFKKIINLNYLNFTCYQLK
jgi:hypothetical protein